jgi:hypothetical protein
MYSSVKQVFVARPRGYREVVEAIKNLHWEKLEAREMQQLMYCSYISAREFAEALRVALELYPEDAQLQEMARGEIETTNLPYEDYTQAGDHADYLEHFIRKSGIEPNKDVRAHGETYLEACRKQDSYVRAMTIFSREEELPGIFQRILQAPDWSAEGLPAFRHYLEKHIYLDTSSGGHHDLTQHFPVDERVKLFYEARLDMYRGIPELFQE